MNINRSATISLCMIVRNEEKHLDRCLNSVAGLVDEIIIIDTGSTDSTKVIAAKHKAKIYDFPWINDFAAARNFGLEKASGLWILVLDADEYLETSTASELQKIVNCPDTADVYLLPLKNIMAPIPGEWQTSLVLRLFKNQPDLIFRGKIHEHVIVPAAKRAELAEKGPVIIHSGYTDELRAEKNARNLQMLQDVITSEPTNPYYHFYISTEYINSGNLEKAEKHILFALQSIPEEVLLFRTAVVKNTVICLMMLHKFKKAKEILENEIEKFQQFPDYYYYLGNIYRETGDFTKAICAFNHALAIKDPTLIGCSIPGSNGYRSQFYRGLCFENIRRYFDAVESFRASLSENPDFDLPFSNFVRCLLFLSRGTQCLNYIEQYFKIENTELQLLLAQLLLVGDCAAEAKVYCDKITDTNLRYRKIFLLGEISLSQGNIQEADNYFSGIPSHHPLFPNVFLLRSLCKWHQTKPSVADIKTVLESSKQEPPLALAKILFLKMLQIKMFDPAESLGSLILKAYPGSKPQLSFLLRKFGALTQAKKLQDSPPVRDPAWYIASAKVFEQLSLNFLKKIPVMPERPMTI
jgi:glycosyltransferase involved in cell wall biosynthesis